MPTQITNIAPNTEAAYSSDVQVSGNVGENAQIIMKKGNLTINGNVNKGAAIEFKREAPQNSGHVFINGNNAGSIINNGGGSTIITQGNTIICNNFGSVSSSSGNTRYLHIKGDVANNVKLKTYNATIKVDGAIGQNCNITSHHGTINAHYIAQGNTISSQNGSITVDNIAENNQLSTHNGNIKAYNIGHNNKLKTQNGNIITANVGQNSRIKTQNGPVHVKDLKPGAFVKTINGPVNARKARRNDISTTFGLVNIGTPVHDNVYNQSQSQTLNQIHSASNTTGGFQQLIFNGSGIGSYDPNNNGSRPPNTNLMNSTPPINTGNSNTRPAHPSLPSTDQPNKQQKTQQSKLSVNQYNSWDRLSNKAHDVFKCPITKRMIKEPVIASDGYTYERIALETRLQNDSSSPVTGETLYPEIYPHYRFKELLKYHKQQLTDKPLPEIDNTCSIRRP